MGDIQTPRPALLLLAAISRHTDALDWAVARAEATWGPIGLRSETFRFVETDYYASSMGQDLWKLFVIFDLAFDPGRLAKCKLETNRWEEQYREQSDHSEMRPLNLDPGYLSESKLVLASTKDHAHRIYLSDGIYAEITLQFHHKKWQPLPWTYPDYRREDYHEFLVRGRDYLRRRRQEGAFE